MSAHGGLLCRSMIAVLLGLLAASVGLNCNGGDGNGDDGAANGWYIYTVDSEGDVGLYTSIDTDLSDRVHISYYQFNTYPGAEGYRFRLKYAEQVPGGWEFGFVGPPAYLAADTHIRLDPSGAVHLNWCADTDEYSEAVLYATNAAGNWEVFAVEQDTGPSVHYDTYHAIDPGGGVHIAYHSNGMLKYATNATGDWKVYVVDDGSGDDVGGHPAIALDSKGALHLCYWNSTRRDLMYATNIDGGWRVFVIDDEGDVGKYADLAIDSHDGVHISYFDRATQALKYATNAPGSWQVFTIDAGVGIGLYTAIAIDSRDAVHISYLDGYNQDLKYATNRSGRWQVFTIDSAGEVGFYTSIAVDSEDYVHIAYLDDSTDDLKYATDRPPN